MPPSPSPSPSEGASTSSKKDVFPFVITTFLIVIGGVLGFIGLIVALLMIWRLIKGNPDLTKQWEVEQEALAKRTSEGLAKHKKNWFKRKQALTKEEKEDQDLKLQFESE